MRRLDEKGAFAMLLESYPKILGIGDTLLANLFDGRVFVEEKFDGCVSLDTPILKADLTYVSAGLLKEGDELIGFDDSLNDPKLRRSIVTAAKPIKKECINLTTDSGKITVSIDHPFLVRQITNNNGKIWITAGNLKIGDRIFSIGHWRRESSWESGYLAGQFDGEGSLVRSGGGRILSYYQKVGEELDLVESLIKARGFTISIDLRQRKPEWARVGALIFRESRWPEILRFLGTFRPQRLLKDAHKIWLDAPLNGLNDVGVLKIEKSPIKTVMGLSTTTRTYIAAGLLSHNSQFRVWFDAKGKTHFGSKAVSYSDERPPDKMFVKAIAQAEKHFAGMRYANAFFAFEYLESPKQNTLEYGRVPKDNLLLLDANIGGRWLLPAEKKTLAEELGFECAPLLFEGELGSAEQLKQLLETTSFLGNTTVEGIVVKNYSQYHLAPYMQGAPVFGKFVREEFKELNRENWGQGIPLEERIMQSFPKEPRWHKAVQHLRERGELTGEARDIGKLITEVEKDFEEECREAAKELLWNEYSHSLVASARRGVAEWYKQKLLEQAFEKPANKSTTS